LLTLTVVDPRANPNAAGRLLAGAVLSLLLAGPGQTAPLPPAAASAGSESGREFVMPERPPIPSEVLVNGEAPADTDTPPTPPGPRIFVRRLALAGVEDRLENGIRIADLQALVDSLLEARLAAADLPSSGELSETALKQELQRLIDNMQKPEAGSEPITPEALQQLIDKLRSEQQKAGLEIGELRDITVATA